MGDKRIGGRLEVGTHVQADASPESGTPATVETNPALPDGAAYQAVRGPQTKTTSATMDFFRGAGRLLTGRRKPPAETPYSLSQQINAALKENSDPSPNVLEDLARLADLTDPSRPYDIESTLRRFGRLTWPTDAPLSARFPLEHVEAWLTSGPEAVVNAIERLKHPEVVDYLRTRFFATKDAQVARTRAEALVYEVAHAFGGTEPRSRLRSRNTDPVDPREHPQEAALLELALSAFDLADEEDRKKAKGVAQGMGLPIPMPFLAQLREVDPHAFVGAAYRALELGIDDHAVLPEFEKFLDGERVPYLSVHRAPPVVSQLLIDRLDRIDWTDLEAVRAILRRHGNTSSSELHAAIVERFEVTKNSIDLSDVGALEELLSVVKDSGTSTHLRMPVADHATWTFDDALAAIHAKQKAAQAGAWRVVSQKLDSETDPDKLASMIGRTPPRPRHEHYRELDSFVPDHDLIDRARSRLAHMTDFDDVAQVRRLLAVATAPSKYSYDAEMLGDSFEELNVSCEQALRLIERGAVLAQRPGDKSSDLVAAPKAGPFNWTPESQAARLVAALTSHVLQSSASQPELLRLMTAIVDNPSDRYSELRSAFTKFAKDGQPEDVFALAEKFDRPRTPYDAPKEAKAVGRRAEQLAQLAVAHLVENADYSNPQIRARVRALSRYLERDAGHKHFERLSTSLDFSPRSADWEEAFEDLHGYQTPTQPLVRRMSAAAAGFDDPYALMDVFALMVSRETESSLNYTPRTVADAALKRFLECAPLDTEAQATFAVRGIIRGRGGTVPAGTFERLFGTPTSFSLDAAAEGLQAAGEYHTQLEQNAILHLTESLEASDLNLATKAATILLTDARPEKIPEYYAPARVLQERLYAETDFEDEAQMTLLRDLTMRLWTDDPEFALPAPVLESIIGTEPFGEGPSVPRLLVHLVSENPKERVRARVGLREMLLDRAREPGERVDLLCQVARTVRKADENPESRQAGVAATTLEEVMGPAFERLCRSIDFADTQIALQLMEVPDSLSGTTAPLAPSDVNVARLFGHGEEIDTVRAVSLRHSPVPQISEAAARRIRSFEGKMSCGAALALAKHNNPDVAEIAQARISQGFHSNDYRAALLADRSLPKADLFQRLEGANMLLMRKPAGADRDEIVRNVLGVALGRAIELADLSSSDDATALENLRCGVDELGAPYSIGADRMSAWIEASPTDLRARWVSSPSSEIAAAGVQAAESMLASLETWEERLSFAKQLPRVEASQDFIEDTLDQLAHEAVKASTSEPAAAIARVQSALEPSVKRDALLDDIVEIGWLDASLLVAAKDYGVQPRELQELPPLAVWQAIPARVRARIEQLGPVVKVENGRQTQKIRVAGQEDTITVDLPTREG